MRIRLIRKLSNVLNGLDLRPHQVGEIIDIGQAPADMLVAEGWAERVDAPLNRATADERHTRGNLGTNRKRLSKPADVPSRRSKKR